MLTNNIYSLALPYVYIVTSKETGKFYIGSRYANLKSLKTPEEDFLNDYFTSGPLTEQLQTSPELFDHTIIFRSGEQIIFSEELQFVVFWYEQLLIREHIDNKLCLNSLYFDPDTAKKVFSRAGKPMSVAALEKLSKKQTGKIFSTEVNAKKASKGEKNGMFNKRQSEEARKIMSEKKKLLVGPLHPRYGKPGTMTGKTVLPVTINGITYRSKNAARKALSTNYYQLGKLVN